jgi:hypothetical protein
LLSLHLGQLIGLFQRNLAAVAPVVGGCALPESSSAVNPFFGNIRQNMDLLGGWSGRLRLWLLNQMWKPLRETSESVL